MKDKIIIKNSVIVLSEDAMDKLIQKYDLADKTPLDCQEFLKRIKYGCRKPACL